MQELKDKQYPIVTTDCLTCGKECPLYEGVHIEIPEGAIKYVCDECHEKHREESLKWNLEWINRKRETDKE